MSRKAPIRSLAAPVFFAATLATLAASAAAASDDTIAERVEVGQKAPAVVLESSDGEGYDLGALTGEKKAVLVFFRGSW